MAFLTVFCKECDRIGLFDEREAPGGAPPCSSCQSSLAIVPGATFASDARPLFEDLLQVVTERTIRPDEAKSLAWHIAQNLRSAADHGALLERLTVRFPGLLALQASVGQNREAALRALRILRAILEAKALDSRAALNPPRASE
jgi:hypothetical protein